MKAIGQLVPAGHRLRLALSTAYWPWAWPSPEPVTLTVHAGRCRSSCRYGSDWAGEPAVRRFAAPEQAITPGRPRSRSSPATIASAQHRPQHLELVHSYPSFHTLFAETGIEMRWREPDTFTIDERRPAVGPGQVRAFGHVSAAATGASRSRRAARCRPTQTRFSDSRPARLRGWPRRARWGVVVQGAARLRLAGRARYRRLIGDLTFAGGRAARFPPNQRRRWAEIRRATALTLIRDGELSPSSPWKEFGPASRPFPQLMTISGAPTLGRNGTPRRSQVSPPFADALNGSSPLGACLMTRPAGKSPDSRRCQGQLPRCGTLGSERVCHSALR